MSPSRVCPKCGAAPMIRVPNDPRRYASGNNIYTSRWTLIEKIPVIRYVCGQCGYVENWIDDPGDIEKIKKAFQ